MPELFGGSADLSESNLTDVKGGGDFTAEHAGRNIRFGVREHAMGGIGNGLAYHGGYRPYLATFLTFSDYMRGSVRLAALSGLPVVFDWTHDSVGLGEDGPTHQPVEHYAALRAIPTSGSCARRCQRDRPPRGPRPRADVGTDRPPPGPARKLPVLPARLKGPRGVGAGLCRPAGLQRAGGGHPTSSTSAPRLAEPAGRRRGRGPGGRGIANPGRQPPLLGGLRRQDAA